MVSMRKLVRADRRSRVTLGSALVLPGEQFRVERFPDGRVTLFPIHVQDAADYPDEPDHLTPGITEEPPLIGSDTVDSREFLDAGYIYPKEDLRIMTADKITAAEVTLERLTAGEITAESITRDQYGFLTPTDAPHTSPTSEPLTYQRLTTDPQEAHGTPKDKRTYVYDNAGRIVGALIRDEIHAEDGYPSSTHVYTEDGEYRGYINEFGAFESQDPYVEPTPPEPQVPKHWNQ